MVKDKPCKYLYKMILGKARGHDEKEETIYPFIVVCNLGIDELDNCPKKKQPLTITPHCWRIGLRAPSKKEQALAWVLALTDVNYGDIKHHDGKKAKKDLDEAEKLKHEFNITDEEIKQRRVIEMERR